MDYILILGIVAVVALVIVLLKQRGRESQSAVQAKAKSRHAASRPAVQAEEQAEPEEWTVQSNASDDNLQSWDWDNTENTDLSTASVSAQEVDPLTEYQVYKQFGYEDKAAVSLAGYLNWLVFV